MKMSRFKEARWVLGDTHFNSNGLFDRIYHKAYKTKDDYIEGIIKNYNNIVNKDDVVIFLGDLGDKRLLPDLIPRMNGYKILIKGNHDDIR